MQRVVANWVLRHQRWLWSTGCVLVVLVIVGFAVRAPVQDWWLTRQACGGKLPADDVGTVRTDARLGSERESFDQQRGEYHCVLENDEGKVVVAVNAYLPGHERDEELRRIGSWYPPYATLPGGLPGFEGANSRVYLMPECPRGAKGPAPEEGRLLVDTWTYFAESREEKAAMLRLAVRMTNEVREKLGCGGAPLPEPSDGAVPDRREYVSRTETKGTACAAFATVPPPRDGRDGEVRHAVAKGSVVGRCTLHAPPTAEDDTYGDDGRPGRPLIELTSWRGNWGPEVREQGSGPQPLPMSPERDWKPQMSEHRAWAVAKCQGENTGYAAHEGDGFSYRKKGEESRPSTAAEQRAEQRKLHDYLTAFARDQVRLGKCTDLRLPERP